MGCLIQTIHNEKSRGGGTGRKHLRPGSVRERRPPNSDIDKSITASCVFARLKSDTEARKEAVRSWLPGVPYPIRTKSADGGARERSREEGGRGIS